MKIIISPSKTQDVKRTIHKGSDQNPYFIDEANELAEEISRLTIEEMASIMKLKGGLLEGTYNNYRNFIDAPTSAAIITYTGTVFKEIQVEEYREDEITFLEEHLLILSALYGVLKPFDRIKPYRLDMKMKVIEGGLYRYWGNRISDLLGPEDLIINLASKEFSKMITQPMITIDFMEKQRGGQYKVVGTYAKKARGMMVNYIIRNKIDQLESIKKFDLDGYRFNPELSNRNLIVFSRCSG